jgi:UDP-N-acetylglucosamine:LPS N-acetylglucosamine transferase
MRLRPAFEGQRVTFVTTDAAYATDVRGQELSIVSDANRDHPLKLIRLAYQVLVRVLRTRPDVVISTGAAPGVFGVVFGRLVGARTLWVDSIANAERLSLSGRIASRTAHIVLTQWPHLAESNGPHYHGAIL